MTQFKQPVEDLAGVLTAAETCFEWWRSRTLSERGGVVAAAAAALHHRREEFVRLLSIERVEHIDCSAAEVDRSVDIMDYYAKCAFGLCANSYLAPMFREKRIGCEAEGVILHVQPSRFPYFSLARFVTLNLTIGNVVVLTHAEVVPCCAVAFEDLWLKAGAPVGAFTNVASGSCRALGTMDQVVGNRIASHRSVPPPPAPESCCTTSKASDRLHGADLLRQSA